MSEWTRRHDHILAVRCEGWFVVSHEGELVRTFASGSFVRSTEDGSLIKVPHYNTDIAACIRAALAYANACGHCDFVINLGKPIGLVAPMEWLDCEVVFGDATRHLDQCKSVEDVCAEVAWALHEAVKDA